MPIITEEVTNFLTLSGKWFCRFVLLFISRHMTHFFVLLPITMENCLRVNHLKNVKSGTQSGYSGNNLILNDTTII